MESCALEKNLEKRISHDSKFKIFQYWRLAAGLKAICVKHALGEKNDFQGLKKYLLRRRKPIKIK